MLFTGRSNLTRVHYSFSILRYVHDAVTQEFLNIGVAVYSPQGFFLQARCTPHYGRLNHTFGSGTGGVTASKIDGERFRQLTRYIEQEVNAIGTRLAGGQLLPLESTLGMAGTSVLATKAAAEKGQQTEAGLTIDQLLARVLPQDDSSIQFSSPAGVGLSRDLEKTLTELFERYVERYAARPQSGGRRDDEDVWRVFRDPLARRQLTGRLAEKRIAAKDYEYNFGRAWKNDIWHVYEPVSFDLADGNSIVEKANRWVGRAVSLSDSSEPFEMHLLLGEPQDEKLRSGAFVRAQNILKRMPGKTELVREAEAEAFAEGLAREMARH